MKEHGDQANGADEDGTTFPGLGKIDYVLTEATVWITIICCIAHMINQYYWPLTKGKKVLNLGPHPPNPYIYDSKCHSQVCQES